MKDAVLDFVDRGLLVALFVGGYAAGLVALGGAGYILLNNFGLVGTSDTLALWSGSMAWLRWSTPCLLVMLAVIAVLAVRTYVPPIASQDPAERPALRVAMTRGGALLAGYAVLHGLRLLFDATRATWAPAAEATEFKPFVLAFGLIAVAALAFVGVAALDTNWPFVRAKSESAQRSRILLP